jgi:hypothetical protein
MRPSAALFVSALVAVVGLAPTPDAAGQRTPTPTLGGFTLGQSFGSAGLRCRERFRFERDPLGTAGTCYGVPQSVGYRVSSVFLRDCDGRLCQISVRVSVEGEAQLRDAIVDITRAWDDRYGNPDAPHDQRHTDHSRMTIPGVAPDDCVTALGGGQYACLLRGTAMFVRDWTGPAGALAEGQRAQLVAMGSAGSQVATLRMTLATARGISESRERDL